ncbi:bifunctional adhesin/ABC transporter aspartate /glutamate-binding protein [Helicobacter muridarum]|uniref:Bifunctional adhesin/ABC transporter aspartate /glutamate-binding protein n=2 Tax=Helicobacter muridarum TaxID=216 RepID=Q4VQI3_9HELI|nr:putative lipoprotein P30Hm13 [Helicobacter muridarum]STQ85863.1 bifunctional adhesin/ABC transporter aspartate /glutamate-binding protein [Helicobacter muridarum]
MTKKYSFTKLFIGALIAIIGMLAIACSESGNNKKANNQIEAIKKRGVLIVGVKKDAPNFALMNHKTQQIEGFEIDMAKMLAKQMLGDENKIKLEPVTAKTRGPLLDNGTLDIVIATFTITDERKKTYNFTESYYSDPIGFLVLKENNFKSFKDLDDKVIGVAQAATTNKVVTEAAADLGITVKIKEFPDYPSLKSALDSKRIDAFSVDKSILRGYLDANNEILDDNLKAQEYGMATRKEDIDWSNYVNNFVKDNKQTIDDLAVKWNLK